MIQIEITQTIIKADWKTAAERSIEDTENNKNLRVWWVGSSVCIESESYREHKSTGENKTNGLDSTI